MAQAKDLPAANVYYFGCWGQAGHYLHHPSGRTLYDRPLNVPLSDSELDCNEKLLPLKEKVGDGKLTYLSNWDFTVISWWGSPWDKRGKVNTSILVKGKHDVDSAWDLFQRVFPDLAPKLTKPTIVETQGLEGPRSQFLYSEYLRTRRELIYEYHKEGKTLEEIAQALTIDTPWIERLLAAKPTEDKTT